MNIVSGFTIAILAILVSACCGDWEYSEEIHSPTWSDDGLEFAYLISSREMEINTGSGFGHVCDIRNREVSFYTDSVEQESPNLVKTVDIPNTVSLYYMKSSGYLLYSYYSDSSMISRVIDLKGNDLFERRTESNYCNVSGKLYSISSLIPSPNGDLIAEISTDSACNGKDTVKIFNRSDFSETSSFSIPILIGQRMRWLPDNSLIVEPNYIHGEPSQYKHIEFGDDVIYRDDDALVCNGVTSSNYISDEGLELRIDIDGKIEVVESTHKELCDWQLN